MKQPCEQFGAERAVEIHDLVEAATGTSCPGQAGGHCPLAPPSEGDALAEERLRVAG